MVERGGLENRCALAYRGFESHPLRQVYSIFQMVRKLRANLEHYANLVSRGHIANALQTPFPEARPSEAKP